MKLSFEKVHGCGNDFIIINNIDNKLNLTTDEISQLCSRHFGIGSDGLILVEKKDNNYFMNYFNSDGSLAEMCGNGMRCTADFIFRNIDNSNNLTIESRSGLHKISIDKQYTVTLQNADFSLNDINSHKTIKIKDKNYPIEFVSMGNPHAVIYSIDDLNISKDEAENILKELNVKDGINLNFVRKINNNSIDVITYERGDGFTLACGTGACASVSILNKNHLVEEEVSVKVPGGNLKINIGNEKILMTGPAQKVFEGVVEL